MTFFCSSLVSAAVSGLLALDHLQAGQFMFSRPFFAGAVLGIICGCPAEGAAIGIAFEFLYSADLPLGSAVPPNGLAGAAAAVLGVKAGLMAAAAFFYGIFLLGHTAGLIQCCAECVPAGTLRRQKKYLSGISARKFGYSVPWRQILRQCS